MMQRSGQLIRDSKETTIVYFRDKSRPRRKKARNVSFISLSFKMSVSGFDYIETLGPHLRSVAFIRAQVLDLKYDAPREENQV